MTLKGKSKKRLYRRGEHYSVLNYLDLIGHGRDKYCKTNIANILIKCLHTFSKTKEAFCEVIRGKFTYTKLQ